MSTTALTLDCGMNYGLVRVYDIAIFNVLTACCSLELNIRQRILADIASNDDRHFAEDLISEKVSNGLCSNDEELMDERDMIYMVR